MDQCDFVAPYQEKLAAGAPVSDPHVRLAVEHRPTGSTLSMSRPACPRKVEVRWVPSAAAWAPTATPTGRSRLQAPQTGGRWSPGHTRWPRSRWRVAGRPSREGRPSARRERLRYLRQSDEQVRRSARLEGSRTSPHQAQLPAFMADQPGVAHDADRVGRSTVRRRSAAPVGPLRTAWRAMVESTWRVSSS